MPANPLTAPNFLLDTDYPLDKIIVGRSGNVIVPAFTSGTVTQAHGLSYTPLMNGSWSLTPDFSIIYNMNSGPVSATPLTAGSPFDQQVTLYSDNTNIYYDVYNFTGSQVTMYLSSYGLQPTTTVFDSPLLTSADNFQLDTDFNYTKLYLSGYFDQAAGTGSPVTFSVPHNLGNNTQATAWAELSIGLIIPINYGDAGIFQLQDVTAAIDSTALTFYFSGSHTSYRIHYRIYLDI